MNKSIYIVLRTSGMIEGCYITSDGAWEMLRKIEKAYATNSHIHGNSLYVMDEGTWVLAAYYVKWPLKTGENTA